MTIGRSAAVKALAPTDRSFPSPKLLRSQPAGIPWPNIMNDIDVLSVSAQSPMFSALLNAAFRIHDRLHDTDPAAFAQVAARIRGIAAHGGSTVSAALIGQLPALEVISVMGVGYDGIDVAAAKARGVKVTHTPNVLNDDVADLAIGLMLSAARQLPAADRFVREGRWLKGNMPLQRKMSGARLGLVGMGRIAQAIAQRALAFGMSVAYTARSRKPDLPFRWFETPAALAGASDYLVVITPGGAATRRLIDADVLRALGPQGILVNVARGSVVDEAALIDALEQGVIAAAGLDVFEDEPKVPQRLLDLPQVVLTPHVGSATDATRQAMADLAFANLRAHFEGRPLLSPVPECAT
jgi:lactate dehydrogenase-like 2-hydroxyacid dehydrogenase